MMTNEKPTLIVKKEYHKWRIALAALLLVFLLGGLGVGVMLVLTNQELRGRASTPQVTPSPLVVSLPPTDLEAPFIRLVTHKETYGFNEKVPIDAYLNTNGQPTMEANLVVTFDSDALEITKKDVEMADLYKSAEIDATEEGKVTMTLFITPSVGHEPVSTTSDTKIATLKFTTKTVEKADTEITLAFTRDGQSGTTLFSYSQSREDTENILQNTEGVKFTITP